MDQEEVEDCIIHTTGIRARRGECVRLSVFYTVRSFENVLQSGTECD